MWLSNTVGAINFTASPHIHSQKMERFCRERERYPGWEGSWMLQFCTLPREKCQTVLAEKLDCIDASHFFEKGALSALDGCRSQSGIQVSVLSFLWILAQNFTLHPFHQPPPWPISQLSSWPEKILSLVMVHSENLSKTQELDWHWKGYSTWTEKVSIVFCQ